MKKLFVLLLAGLVLMSFTGAVFAEESGDLPPDSKGRGQVKSEILKEFQDETHSINALKIDKLNLKIEVVQKQDVILDLDLSARDAGNTDALQEAKEVRKEVKELNKEIKDVQVQVAAERKAFREEVRNGEMDTAREHINEIISLKETINEKMTDKIDLLNEIMEILS